MKTNDLPKIFENKWYSDAVEILPFRKTNLRKPISAWLGWNDKNGVYDPMKTELSPQPASVAELSMCKCTTGSLTQRCKCKKNGFVCSELHHCKSCTNIEGNLYPYFVIRFTQTKITLFIFVNNWVITKTESFLLVERVLVLVM